MYYKQYGITLVIIRVVQFVFAAIVLGIAANLVNNLNRPGGSPGRINYEVFVGTFALLTLLITAFGFFFRRTIGHPLFIGTFDFLNIVFTLAAGVSTAVGIRVHNCANQDYLNSNGITQGSENRCRQAQALTAFTWFLFGAYVLSFAFEMILLFNDGYSGSSGKRQRKASRRPQAYTVPQYRV